MIRTLILTIPVALGGAVSPVLLVALIGMLAAGWRSRAWAFATGAAITTVVVTLGFWLLFRHHAAGVPSGAHPHRAALVDLVIGGLLLLWGLYRLPRWKRVKAPAPPKEGGGTFTAFLAGCALMITNLSTFAFIVVQAKLVAHSSIPVSQQLVVLAVDTVIVLTLVWLPLLLTIVMPRSSARVLGSIRHFFDTRGPHTLTVVLVVLGIYLIAHGVLTW
jgi:hypothetical protein